MSGGRGVAAVKVLARVREPLLLTGWSGSFVSLLAYEALGKAVGSPEPGSLAVTPLYSAEGRTVLSGLVAGQEVRRLALEPGSEVAFRVTVRADYFSSDFVDALVEVCESRGLLVDSLEARVERGVPRKGAPGEKVFVDVRFDPTTFIFRSVEVLYPSPQRLVFSLARLASQLAGVDPARAKRAGSRLSRMVELVDWRVRRVRLYIGRKRVVPAFTGTARYLVYGRPYADLFLSLLSFGELVNVGKSRGIGFGAIRVEGVREAR